MWKNRNGRPNIGGVSARSRNGGLPRKGAWSMVKRLRQAASEYAPRLSPPLVPAPLSRMPLAAKTFPLSPHVASGENRGPPC